MAVTLNDIDIETLRQRGLIVSNADGIEGLLISVQYLRPLPPGATHSEWRERLQRWCENMAGTLDRHGAKLFPETLSTSAQTVEAFVPVDRLEETFQCEPMKEVRIDLIMSHRVTL